MVHLNNAISVSYTHLDVYKRQMLKQANEEESRTIVKVSSRREEEKRR